MPKMTRDEAQAAIEALMEQVKSIYKQAQKIADQAGVSFYSYDPKERSTQYYPKRPSDWKVWNEWEGEEEDPNRNHPEHEYYHPWNEGGEYEYDWSKGHWVSSSERC